MVGGSTGAAEPIGAHLALLLNGATWLTTSAATGTPTAMEFVRAAVAMVTSQRLFPKYCILLHIVATVNFSIEKFWWFI